MAILNQSPELKPNEELTAQLLNDISETAVVALKEAQKVEAAINEAIGKALNSEV